jgi:hypothetical protein
MEALHVTGQALIRSLKDITHLPHGWNVGEVPEYHSALDGLLDLQL